jgi:hypothetical protein
MCTVRVNLQKENKIFSEQIKHHAIKGYRRGVGVGVLLYTHPQPLGTRRRWLPSTPNDFTTGKISHSIRSCRGPEWVCTVWLGYKSLDSAGTERRFSGRPVNKIFFIMSGASTFPLHGRLTYIWRELH